MNAEQLMSYIITLECAGVYVPVDSVKTLEDEDGLMFIEAYTYIPDEHDGITKVPLGLVVEKCMELRYNGIVIDRGKEHELIIHEQIFEEVLSILGSYYENLV